MAEPIKDDKKVLRAQADQMFKKAEFHAPSKPKTLVESVGAPAAQGMNLSKEEEEFAAAAAADKKADALPEEKIPAPRLAVKK